MSYFADAANILVEQLVDAWVVWEKCRRCYKWFSIIQLWVAWVSLAGSAFCFVCGTIMTSSGACCTSFGHSMGKTQWFYVDEYGNSSVTRTEDHGAVCKCYGCVLMLAGMALYLACFILYAIAWLMLGLTFIYCYEEVDELAPVKLYVLKHDTLKPQKYPEVMHFYPKMNRNVRTVGKVDKTMVIPAQKVYTGWVRTMEEPPRWIATQTRAGKNVFKEFETEQDALDYVNDVVAEANIILVEDLEDGTGRNNLENPLPEESKNGETSETEGKEQVEDDAARDLEQGSDHAKEYQKVASSE